MEVLGATQNQTPILGLDTWKPPVVPKSSYVTQQE